MAPLRYASREKLLVFGAADRAVPSQVSLTLGVRDVLVLENDSPAPLVFGQWTVLPGRASRLPFGEVGTFGFTCSARPDRREITVQVVAPPDPGAARLRWRIGELLEALRTLPIIAPMKG